MISDSVEEAAFSLAGFASALVRFSLCLRGKLWKQAPKRSTIFYPASCCHHSCDPEFYRCIEHGQLRYTRKLDNVCCFYGGGVFSFLPVSVAPCFVYQLCKKPVR